MYISQPTPQPTSKVAAAGVGGSITVLVVYIAKLFGLEIPAEVASALTALIAFGSGYIQKEKVI